MSTRGYYGIKKNGKLKGTYNHWDSYPSGLGVELVEEINKIKKEDRIKVLSDTFDYIELINENSIPTKEQQDMCVKANVVDLNVSSRSLEDWYCLLRNTQGKLNCYIDRVVPYMSNGNSFLENTLFCEWSYIINLDTKKLEVNKIANFDLLDLKVEDMLDLEEY